MELRHTDEALEASKSHRNGRGRWGLAESRYRVDIEMRARNVTWMKMYYCQNGGCGPSVHDRTTTGFTFGCRDSESDQDRLGRAVPIAGALEAAGWCTSQWENVEPHEAGRPRRRLHKLTGGGQRRAREALSGLQLGTGVPAWAT
jgi:hypothetical protein